MSRTVKKSVKKSVSDQKDLDSDFRDATGNLLETAGMMHSFSQALNASRFREFVDYMGRPWYSFWFNFLIGIARGLGFVIGATVVVTIVVWIISRVLSQFPFVGEFFDTLGQLLSQENLQRIQDSTFLESVKNVIDSAR